MHKGYLRTATLLGALSIALGAFAAHALKQIVSDYALGIFETGVRYEFYHVFALLASGILYKEFHNKFTRWSGIFYIAGMILFSGSLYVLAIIKASVMPGYYWVETITPVVGLCFFLCRLRLFLGITSKL